MGGYLSDRNGRLGVVSTVALFPISLLGLYLLGDHALVAVALLALTGFAVGASIPVLSNRVMRVSPFGMELGGAGNAVAFNVGVATVAHAGIRQTALIGAAVALVGLVVALSSVTSASRESVLTSGRADR